MVAPLLAAIAGALGGLAGGAILGSKKDMTSPLLGVKHEPYEYYAPVTGIQETHSEQYMYAPQVSHTFQGGDLFWESPYASTKKEATTTQTSTPSQTATQTPTQDLAGAVQGTNMTYVALIAVAGLVAYGYVSTRKKK